jgi:hypothetical protein
MDGQRAVKSLNADLDALEKELMELHKEFTMAAAQENDQTGADEGGMVIRGK